MFVAGHRPGMTGNPPRAAARVACLLQHSNNLSSMEQFVDFRRTLVTRVGLYAAMLSAVRYSAAWALRPVRVPESALHGIGRGRDCSSLSGLESDAVLIERAAAADESDVPAARGRAAEWHRCRQRYRPRVFGLACSGDVWGFR